MPGFGGWFGRKELAGGGPLIDLGVHRLDLALWLMDHPKPVLVVGSTYDRIASPIARAEGGKSGSASGRSADFEIGSTRPFVEPLVTR